jgi:hypothetical protein
VCRILCSFLSKKLEERLLKVFVEVFYLALLLPVVLLVLLLAAFVEKVLLLAALEQAAQRKGFCKILPAGKVSRASVPAAAKALLCPRMSMSLVYN